MSANSTRPIADINSTARRPRAARPIPRRVAKKLRFSMTLRHVADSRDRPTGRAPHGVAEDRCIAAVRSQHRREHPDQGRLAGTIGSEQTEDHPGGDGQVHAVDGPVLAEGPAESSRLDCEQLFGLHWKVTSTGMPALRAPDVSLMRTRTSNTSLVRWSLVSTLLGVNCASEATKLTVPG